MPTVTYTGAFGEKKKRAVSRFIREVNDRTPVPEVHVVGRGGDVVAFCSIKGHTNKEERSARQVMSRASQDVLNTHGVWVVGVPKLSKP